MGETKAVIRQPQSDKHSLELSELPFAFGLGVEQLEQQTTKTRLLPMLNKITVKQRLHKLEGISAKRIFRFLLTKCDFRSVAA